MVQKIVSIILPTYNRAYIIHRAIESVLAQTYQAWELVVVDDASEDYTVEVVGKYTDARIIFLKNKENRGANFCRDFGVQNAKGDYLAFLDSDNYWKKDKLEKQVKALEGSSEKIAFTFCAGQFVEKDQSIAVVPDRIYEMEELRTLEYQRNLIDTNTLLMKREVYEKVGGFDWAMPRIQDWEFVFRILCVYNYDCIYLNECLNTNEIQNDSITRDEKKLIDAKIYFLKKHQIHYNNCNLTYNFIYDLIFGSSTQSEYLSRKILECLGDAPQILSVFFEVITKKAIRSKVFYDVLYQWKWKEEQKGISIFTPLWEQGENSVAIYGLGKWGELIYQELKKCPIRLVCGIDKTVTMFHELPIRKPEELLDDIDIIVVSVFQEFEQIRVELEKHFSGEIVSIAQLIEYS